MISLVISQQWKDDKHLINFMLPYTYNCTHGECNVKERFWQIFLCTIQHSLLNFHNYWICAGIKNQHTTEDCRRTKTVKDLLKDIFRIQLVPWVFYWPESCHPFGMSNKFKFCIANPVNQNTWLTVMDTYFHLDRILWVKRNNSNI
jgi:hypothetical protein